MKELKPLTEVDLFKDAIMFDKEGYHLDYKIASFEYTDDGVYTTTFKSSGRSDKK